MVSFKYSISILLDCTTALYLIILNFKNYCCSTDTAHVEYNIFNMFTLKLKF